MAALCARACATMSFVAAHPAADSSAIVSAVALAALPTSLVASSASFMLLTMDLPALSVSTTMPYCCAWAFSEASATPLLASMVASAMAFQASLISRGVAVPLAFTTSKACFADAASAASSFCGFTPRLRRASSRLWMPGICPSIAARCLSSAACVRSTPSALILPASPMDLSCSSRASMASKLSAFGMAAVKAISIARAVCSTPSPAAFALRATKSTASIAPRAPSLTFPNAWAALTPNLSNPAPRICSFAAAHCWALMMPLSLATSMAKRRLWMFSTLIPASVCFHASPTSCALNAPTSRRWSNACTKAPTLFTSLNLSEPTSFSIAPWVPSELSRSA